MGTFAGHTETYDFTVSSYPDLNRKHLLQTIGLLLQVCGSIVFIHFINSFISETIIRWNTVDSNVVLMPSDVCGTVLTMTILGVAELPGRVDEVVRVCPVGEQLAGFHIVHSDVHISEGLWEKVVNLPRHIQDVAHTEKNRHELQ